MLVQSEWFYWKEREIEEDSDRRSSSLFGILFCLPRPNTTTFEAREEHEDWRLTEGSEVRIAGRGAGERYGAMRRK